MKKALSLMLALAICLGLAITSAYASEFVGIELLAKDGTRTKINPDRQATPLSGNGWRYTPDTRTLTLENFDGHTLDIGNAGRITVELKGNNFLSGSGDVLGPDGHVLIYGDYGKDHCVTITGDGTLTTDGVEILGPLVQAGGTVTTTLRGVCLNSGPYTSFHMTGGTLNAIGNVYGINACTNYFVSGKEGDFQGQILLEGGTVTAQGGLAAIALSSPAERSPDFLSFGGREIRGGETKAKTEVMSIQSTKSGNYLFTSIAKSGLSLKNQAVNIWPMESNAAKYVYIADTQSNQPTTPTEPEQPTTPTQPQQPAEVKTANPTNDKLEVNGAAADPTVYKIGGSNYFKIRDVAAVLNGTEKQFAVGYSGGKVTVTSGQPYEATGKELAGAPDSAKDASPSNDAIVIDGVETSLTVYKIGGSNYFKLRDLGEALNFYVGWESGRGVYIETDKPYSK